MALTRRIRGTVVSGAIWAVLGGAVGIGLGLAFVTPHPPLGAEGPSRIQIAAGFGVLFATLGATAGVLFATAVLLLNRIRAHAQLSPWFAALLGALAAAVATLPVSARVGNLLSIAAFGAVLAGGIAAMAQRSRRQTPDSHPGAGT